MGEGDGVCCGFTVYHCHLLCSQLHMNTIKYTQIRIVKCKHQAVHFSEFMSRIIDNGHSNLRKLFDFSILFLLVEFLGNDYVFYFCFVYF